MRDILFLLAFAGIVREQGESPVDAQIRQREAECARMIAARVHVPEIASPADACPVTRYRERVRTETWQEVRPDADGAEKAIPVHGEIWTAAIQAALNEHRVVHIEQRRKPYYIDAPLILTSGRQLLLDPGAELRLKPHSNCCMVRNAHPLNGQTGPVPLAEDADHDIVISGGVWTTLATTRRQSNGNVRGHALAKGMPPAHGVILLSNVRRVRVTGVTIRECRPHGIQISNCSEFMVERIRFEDQRRDGVHINGPAAYGIIRDIRNARGEMGDDMLALNAWDWKNTVPSFGPIHHVLVENVDGLPASDSGEKNETRPAHAGAEIRLLAGTKHFPDGKTLDCNIEHCVLRGIAGIRTVKMYDQPNLELGRTRDFADPIGYMTDLFFSDIRIEHPPETALFQVHSNVGSMAIRHVTLGFEPRPGNGLPFPLVRIGPLSQTYKHDRNDPKRWVEIFSPNKDCTVERLYIHDVRTGAGGRATGDRAPAADTLVRVIRQTVNPDYPKTTPRGGTGTGRLLYLNDRPFGRGPDGDRVPAP